MRPTEVLKQEHEVIKRMIGILETACDRLERGEELPANLFRQVVDFIRTFADRCHHGKEEDFLFPRLEERGIPREGGPLEVMLLEHEEGRHFVRGMAEAAEKYGRGEAGAKAALVENARGYTTLLTSHIAKENDVLYPMGEQVLTEADEQELLERFEEVEQVRIGEGKHEEYHQLVHRLEAQLGR